MNKHSIDIPTWTIIKIILILLGLIFLWFIRDIIILLLITWILVAILYPTVERLHKNGIPRILGATLMYALLFAIFAVIVSLIVPSFVQQMQQLIDRWPLYVERFAPFYESIKGYAAILGLSTRTTEIITPLTGSVYGFTLNFISGLISTIIVLVITFYVLIEEEAIKKFWVSLAPTNRKDQVIGVLDKITQRWGAWIRGRIILSIVMGLLTYIALLILGIPYALTLGILVALLDIVPFIGPILATIPAAIIAYATTGSWLMALLVVIVFFLIQQLEAYLLAPKIMQKVVGISPISVIISILIGAKLLGLMGIILAVPVAAGIAVIFEEWRKFKKTT